MKLVSIILGVLIAVGVIMFFGFYQKESRMAYLNTTQVYEGFTLKKELETKLNKVKEERKNMLDSLALKVNILTQKLSASPKVQAEEAERYEFLRQQYLQKKQKADEESAELARQYNDQIWEQLNQYVKDFGSQHKYKFIFGSRGDGNLMYAEEQDNITEEIVKYVNERYNGKEK